MKERDTETRTGVLNETPFPTTTYTTLDSEPYKNVFTRKEDYKEKKVVLISYGIHR